MTATVSTTATDVTPSPESAEAARARRLRHLGDYVRLLADRMGMQEWKFVVKFATDDDGPNFRIMPYRGRRGARVEVTGRYFDRTPESRRFFLCVDLLELRMRAVHEFARETMDEDDRTAFDRLAVGGLAGIALAWAPTLPLPLVGLMEHAAGRTDARNRT